MTTMYSHCPDCGERLFTSLHVCCQRQHGCAECAPLKKRVEELAEENRKQAAMLDLVSGALVDAETVKVDPPDQAIRTLTEQNRKLREELHKIVDAWFANWDCSRSPGHGAVVEAINHARELLEYLPASNKPSVPSPTVNPDVLYCGDCGKPRPLERVLCEECYQKKVSSS